MPEDPCDALSDGISALSAISSLLLSGAPRGDLHLVDPEDLCALLDLIRHRLDDARRGFSGCNPV